MAIRASKDVADFLKWVTGEEMPGLNEDRLFAIAEEYQAVATALLDELAPLIVKAVDGIRAHFDGEAERAYAAMMAKFVTTAPRHLHVAAEEYAKASRLTYQVAVQVEYAKLMIILTIVELMLEVAAAIAMAVFFPGAGAWIAAKMTFTRVAVSKLLQRLFQVIAHVVSSVAMGVGMQLAMDMLAQGIQWGRGHRNGFDGEMLAQSAGVGALGGLVGLVLGAGAGAAVNGLGKGGGKQLGKAGSQHAGPPGLHGAGRGRTDVPAGLPSGATRGNTSHGGLGHKALDTGSELLVEGGSEYLTEGLYTTIKDGEWDVDGAAFVSGLVSGAAGATGGAIGSGIAHARPDLAIVKAPPGKDVGQPDGTGNGETRDVPDQAPGSTDDGPTDIDPNSTEGLNPGNTSPDGPAETDQPTDTSSDQASPTDRPGGTHHDGAPSGSPDRPGNGSTSHNGGPATVVPPSPAGDPSPTDLDSGGTDHAGTGIGSGKDLQGGTDTGPPGAEPDAGDPTPAVRPENSPAPQHAVTGEQPSAANAPTGPQQTPPPNPGTGVAAQQPVHPGIPTAGSPAPVTAGTPSSSPSTSSSPVNPIPVTTGTPATIGGPPPAKKENRPGPPQTDDATLPSVVDPAALQSPDATPVVPVVAPVALTGEDLPARADGKDTTTSRPATDPRSPVPDSSVTPVTAAENRPTTVQGDFIASTKPDATKSVTQAKDQVYVFPSRKTPDADVRAAKMVPTSPNSTRLAVHLTNGRAEVDGQLLTATEFADVVKRTIPDLRGRIELVACSAAGPTALSLSDGRRHFAHDLALALGRPVVGATTPAWSALNPNAPRTLRTIAATIVVDPDGRMRPRIPPDGQFIEFTPNPDGAVTERPLGPALDEMPTALDSSETDGTPEDRSSTDQAAGAYHMWAQLVSGLDFTAQPVMNPTTLTIGQRQLSGLIGGSVVPVVAYQGADALRAELGNKIRQALPDELKRIGHLVDSELATQLTDEVLADWGVRSMLNGSGMPIRIGTGQDAVDVVLRANADLNHLKTLPVGDKASAQSNAAVSNGQPDIREPARAGAAGVDQDSGSRGFSLGAGFSTVTAGIMGFFGSLSVTGSHRVGKSAALSRGSRTNMEITRSAGTDSALYQVPLTDMKATLERRGAPKVELNLTPTTQQAATAQVPSKIASVQTTTTGMAPPTALPSRWVYEGGTITPRSTTNPATSFAEQVLALMPPGVTKAGSKNRADILELLTPESLANLDGALSYAGHRSDKFVSRTGAGKGLQRWMARISKASKNSLSLTSTVGTPELVAEMNPGKAETAVRVEGVASRSKTQEKVTQVAATAGGFRPFHEVTDPAFVATLEAGAVARADRSNSSENAKRIGYRTDMKSKHGDNQLLYKIPVTVTAKQVRGTTPREVKGDLTVYAWLTPHQAQTLGFPLPPTSATTGPDGAAQQSLPEKQGTTNSGEPFQPLPLADVTHMETKGDLVDAAGNSLNKPETDLATELIKQARSIDSDLLPPDGELGTELQRANLGKIREAASRPSLTGRWRSLRGGGIDVVLQRDKRGSSTGSRNVVLTIRTELGALNPHGQPSPKTQLELVTQGFTVQAGQSVSSVGAAAGVTAGGRIRTSWWGASRGLFARLVVAWNGRWSRSMAGTSTYLDSHLTKVEGKLHNYAADVTFVVSQREVAGDGLVKDTSLFRLKSGNGFQVAVPDGTKPPATPTASTSATPSMPTTPPRKAGIVVNPATPAPGGFTLTGPHAFVDADISPKMADAIDIALAKNGTVTTGTGPAATNVPIRTAGKPPSGWGSPGRRKIQLDGNRTVTVELSHLSDPGSLADRQIKELLATPEGVMSLLELMDETGSVDLMRLGIFSDLTGSLTAKFDLSNPKILRNLAKAKLYDSAETTTGVASGSSSAHGFEYQAQAGVATATPNGDHRQAPGGQLGGSYQKSAAKGSDSNATVGRRLVYDGPVSELLADATVTITGKLGSADDQAPGTQIQVQVSLPESVVVLVSADEAQRLVPTPTTTASTSTATASTATATGTTAAGPANPVLQPPGYLPRLVGNAYVNSVDHGWINATTAATTPLANQLVDSTSTPLPDALRPGVTKAVDRLLSLGGLRRGIQALYSGGRTSTFTIPGLLEKQVVKVTVTAENTGVSTGTKMDDKLSVSLFQAEARGTRTAGNRRRVFGGGFGLTAMFSRASANPVNGPGLITNLDAAGFGVTGSGSIVDDNGRAELTIDGSSGYVEKSGQLVEFAMSHNYKLTVTSQRVPTALGAAWNLIRFQKPGSRTTWATSDTGGVDRHADVKIAVPETATDRFPDLTGIGTSTALADPTVWAPAEQPNAADPDQLWVPEGRSVSIEGALLGEIRNLIKDAFTAANGTVPTLVQDQTTDLILDRLMAGETNIAALGSALRKGGFSVTSLHDGTGLLIKTADLQIEAALLGDPIVADAGKTDQEAQTESTTVKQGQSSSSSGVQTGLEQINTGDAGLGTTPPPNPKHLLSETTAGGGAAGRGAGHQSGAADSGGRKVKQSGHSAALVYNLAIRISPVEGSDRKDLTPATMGKVITKGAMVRFWEGDLKALGYTGWSVSPNFPKNMKDLAGTAVLKVENGQLVMHPENTVADAQSQDSSRLKVSGERTLTIKDQVKYSEVLQFLKDAETKGFPAPERIVFEPRPLSQATDSAGALVRIVNQLDSLLQARPDSAITVEIRGANPTGPTWQQVQPSLTLTGNPLTMVGTQIVGPRTWPLGLTAAPQAGTFIATDGPALGTTGTGPSTSTAAHPTPASGQPATRLGLPANWVVEAVPAGWWVRPEPLTARNAAKAAIIRLTPPDPNRPRIWVDKHAAGALNRTTLLENLRSELPDAAARAVVIDGSATSAAKAAALWQHAPDAGMLTIQADPVPSLGPTETFHRGNRTAIEHGKQTWEKIDALISGTSSTVPPITKEAIENLKQLHAGLGDLVTVLQGQIDAAKARRTTLNNLVTQVRADATAAGTPLGPELDAASTKASEVEQQLPALNRAINHAEAVLQTVTADRDALRGWADVTDAQQVADLLTDLHRGHLQVNGHLVVPSIDTTLATTDVTTALNAAAGRWRREVEAASKTPNEPNTVRIYVHGSANRVRAGNRMLTAGEFANGLPDEFRQSLKGKQLILIACRVARSEQNNPSFADQFATALQKTGLTEIVASPHLVATGADGTAYALSEINGTTLVPVPMASDGWRHIPVNQPAAAASNTTSEISPASKLRTIRQGDSGLTAGDILTWPQKSKKKNADKQTGSSAGKNRGGKTGTVASATHATGSAPTVDSDDQAVDREAQSKVEDKIASLGWDTNEDPQLERSPSHEDWALTPVTKAKSRDIPHSWGRYSALHHKVSKTRLEEIGERLAEDVNKNKLKEARRFWRLVNALAGKEVATAADRRVQRLLWNLPLNLSQGPQGPVGDAGTAFDPDTEPDEQAGHFHRRLHPVSKALESFAEEWANFPDAEEDVTKREKAWLKLSIHLTDAADEFQAKGGLLAPPLDEQWLSGPAPKTGKIQHIRKGLRRSPGIEEGTKLFDEERKKTTSNEDATGPVEFARPVLPRNREATSPSTTESQGTRTSHDAQPLMLKLIIDETGLRHIAERHTMAHFDFADIKGVNTFWPPGTTPQKLREIATELLPEIWQKLIYERLPDNWSDPDDLEWATSEEIKIPRFTAKGYEVFLSGPKIEIEVDDKDQTTLLAKIDTMAPEGAEAYLFHGYELAEIAGKLIPSRTPKSPDAPAPSGQISHPDKPGTEPQEYDVKAKEKGGLDKANSEKGSHAPSAIRIAVSEGKLSDQDLVRFRGDARVFQVLVNESEGANTARIKLHTAVADHRVGAPETGSSPADLPAVDIADPPASNQPAGGNKPWTVFGLDGRDREQIASAVDVGYRRFDAAASYRSAHREDSARLLAEVLREKGVPRGEYEVVYKFDLIAGESLKDLENRLRATAESFGGRLDDLLIHNVQGLSPGQVIPVWDLMRRLRADGVVTRLGLGNVEDSEVALVEEVSRRGRIDVIENSAESLFRAEELRTWLARQNRVTVYYYGARALLNDVVHGHETAIDTAAPATMELFAQILHDEIPGETHLISSSGDPERQSANLQRNAPRDYVYPQGPLTDRLTAWRETSQFVQSNGPELNLPDDVRNGISHLLNPSTAESWRAQIGQTDIVEWLIENRIFTREQMATVRVPDRVGLRRRYAGKTLGEIAVALLGPTNCQWKWASELAQTLLSPVDFWMAGGGAAMENVTGPTGAADGPNPIGAWYHAQGSVTRISPLVLRDYGLLLDVNPYRERGGDYMTNCELTAIATDMALRDGDPHQAPPAEPGPDSHIENYAGRPLTSMPGLATVVRLMAESGPGARGIVVFGTPGSTVDHAVNVVHDKNGVVFLDGQLGDLAHLPSKPVRIRFVPTTPMSVDRNGDGGTITPAGAPVTRLASAPTGGPARMPSSTPQNLTGGWTAPVAASLDPRTVAVAQHPVPAHEAYLTYRDRNRAIADGCQVGRTIRNLLTGTTARGPVDTAVTVSPEQVGAYRTAHGELREQRGKLAGELAAARALRADLAAVISLNADLQRLDTAIGAAEQSLNELDQHLDDLAPWSGDDDGTLIVDFLTDLARGYRTTNGGLVIPSLRAPDENGNPRETLAEAATRWRDEIDHASRVAPDLTLVRIFAHGAVGTVRHGARQVTAAELVGLLPQDLWEGLTGRRLQLVACYAGRSPADGTGSFADEFAAALSERSLPGRPLLSWSDAVGTGRDGTIYALRPGPDGTLRPVAAAGHGWYSSPSIPSDSDAAPQIGPPSAVIEPPTDMLIWPSGAIPASAEPTASADDQAHHSGSSAALHPDPGPASPIGERDLADVARAHTDGTASAGQHARQGHGSSRAPVPERAGPDSVRPLSPLPDSEQEVDLADSPPRPHPALTQPWRPNPPREGYLYHGSQAPPKVIFEEGLKSSAKLSGTFTPHYDLSRHVHNAAGSGFVSTTANLNVAYQFVRNTIDPPLVVNGQNFLKHEGYIYYLDPPPNTPLIHVPSQDLPPDLERFRYQEEWAALDSIPARDIHGAIRVSSYYSAKPDGRGGVIIELPPGGTIKPTYRRNSNSTAPTAPGTPSS